MYKWNDSLAKRICCCLRTPKWEKDIRNLEKVVNETKTSMQKTVASQSTATTSTTTTTNNEDISKTDASVNISVDNNVIVNIDSNENNHI